MFVFEDNELFRVLNSTLTIEDVLYLTNGISDYVYNITML